MPAGPAPPHAPRIRLASSVARLRPHYDVVVVGSGYGGAVAAARLAVTGKSVCVLERGRELHPGDFPATLLDAVQEFQIDLPQRHLFSPTGLYDFRVNSGMNVFVGCGLGGTSLINANVVLEPAREIWQDRTAWPAAITDDPQGLWPASWFRRARQMLAPEIHRDPREFAKVRALERVAGGLGMVQQRTPVTVAFGRRGGRLLSPLREGEHPCIGCGDCVAGCNFGAKKTLLTNYLPLARDRGAHIFTEVKVRGLSKAGTRSPRRWLVHVDLLGAGRDRFRAGPLTVAADAVVLAAGTLGSTEILLRSGQEFGLSLSRMLGQKFSGNGDALAFVHNTTDPVNAVGLGGQARPGLPSPGPTIMGSYQAPVGGEPSFLLQEGVIPGALSAILPLSFAFAASGARHDTRRPAAQRWREFWRRLAAPIRGELSSTQTFLVMAPDPRHGRLALHDDRIRVAWPAAENDLDRRIKDALHRAAATLGGLHVASPFGRVTVHPLGGCPMADSVDTGVVNHYGRVFDGRGGKHPGLYVCDASIIPRALGVNPLLTITALAERATTFIANEVVTPAA